MAVTKSKSQDISSPEGNSLAVFLDGNDNILKVKDIYGVMQSFDSLTNAVEDVEVEADSGLTVIRVGDIVTLGTDGAVLQRKDEKGVANGYASLDADGKIPIDQLPNSVLTYEGLWDAATNDPTLVDGTGNDGDFYIVSVGGTQDLGSGAITFEVGDWVIYNGTTWQRNPSATETLQTVTDRGSVTTNGITTASTTSDFFALNTEAGITPDVGQAAWSEAQETWSLGVGTNGSSISGNVLVDTFYPLCKNTDSIGDLPKGTLVMVDTTDIATDGVLNVVRANTSGNFSAQLMVGLLAEDFEADGTGKVQWFGSMTNVPISNINENDENWQEGNVLYADPINRGGLTRVPPQAPNKKSTIAVVTEIDGQNCSLLIRPWLGQSLNELNNVNLGFATSDKSLIQYDSATSTWVDVEGTTTSIAEGLNLYFTQARARASFSATDGVGYTEATGVFTNTDKGSSQNIIKSIDADSGTITADSNNDSIQIIGGTNVTTGISGKTLTINSTDQFQGTVTSVAVTESGGLSVTGSPITTAGTINIENTDKGSSQNIFKNIASSGQPTIVAGSNNATFFVEGAGTTSITQDAGTNTITITSNDAHEGTVTSVDITAGSGISSSGGPITSSGSITVTNTDKGSDQNIFKQVASDTGDTFATSNNSVLSIFGASGEGIYTATSGAGHVEIYNSDKGSSQNIFKNVAVSGQSTIVADDNDDTLTFAEGANITITTDAATDTITISSPDAGGTVTSVDLTAGAGMVVSGGPITTSGSITVTNNDRGSEQLIFKNFNADTGSVSASTNNDTLTIEGGTNVTTSISGSTLTINSTDQYDGTVTSVAASAGSGISVSGSPITTSGTLTITNTDTGSAQNIFKNVASDSGTAVADNNNDTLTIAGGTNVTTSVSGDTLTINSTDQFTGTVTSVGITAGNSIDVTGGPITTSGSITVSHADTSTLNGTYGSTLNGTKIDTITVDANGHVTAVTTGATGDIEGITAGTGLSGGGISGTVTLTNTDRGSSQNIFKNVASDSGTAVADNNNDTLTIAGGTNVTTSVSGDTLTINATSTPPPIALTGTSSVVNQYGSNSVLATAQYSSVLSGSNNTVAANIGASTISGGMLNVINNYASYSTIAGGMNNRVCASATRSFIGAGQQNKVCRTSATSCAAYGVVVGGAFNDVDNQGVMDGYPAPIASVVGGYGNKAIGAGSFIGGGFYSLAVSLSGVTNNEASGMNSIVVGGSKNCANAIGSAVVGGGAVNSIIGFPCGNSANGANSFIGSGGGNSVGGGGGSAIVAGIGGTMCGFTTGGFIGTAGAGNFVPSPCVNDSCISSGNAMVIGAGNCIPAYAGVQHSFIGAGRNHSINSCFSSVVSGYRNCIMSNSCYSAIGGGRVNLIDGNSCSAIAGGESNCIILGGQTSFIGAGRSNQITSYAYSSAIVAGDSNYVKGGRSFIGGGAGNSIVPPDGFNAYSAVLGGAGNAVSGSTQYSAILGGRGNNINSQSHSFIAGSGIVADRPYTLFANNLSLTSLPTSASGLPAGSVWNNGGVLNIV